MTDSPTTASAAPLSTRPITESDVASVQALNESALPHVTSLTIDACRGLVGQSSIGLAVEAEGASGTSLVGFCIVLGPGLDYSSVNYRWVMDRYDDALYLDRVVVASQWRGRGVGRLIYNQVEQRMRSDWPQYPTLTLEVNLDPPNPESLAFHRKLGFSDVGEQTTPYGARVTLMAKSVPVRGAAHRG